jgi:hypothetical protein
MICAVCGRFAGTYGYAILKVYGVIQHGERLCWSCDRWAERARPAELVRSACGCSLCLGPVCDDEA